MVGICYLKVGALKKGLEYEPLGRLNIEDSQTRRLWFLVGNGGWVIGIINVGT